MTRTALIIIALFAVAIPAVVFARPEAGLLQSGGAALPIVIVALGLLTVPRRRTEFRIAIATTLAFAALTPLAGEHSPWPSGGAPDAFAVQRDLNVLMPALLIGGLGVMMLPRRKRAWRVIAALAAGGILATVAGAPGDLRVLAIPFWWHVPAGVRTIRRLLVSPRPDPLMSVVGAVAVIAVAGFAWGGTERWLSGVGVALGPLLGDGPPGG